MTTYRQLLITAEIYHVFNRSIGKVDIFRTDRFLYKIKEIVNYYRYPQRIRLSKFNDFSDQQKIQYLNSIKNNTPLVEIYAYSFMPNHFHLLLKQLQDGGITQFLSNTQNSFAKYFNLINDRDGGLFQRSFKAKRITNNEEFIHISRYIHLNHTTARIIDFSQLLKYGWCSLPEYINNVGDSFVETTPILNYFKTSERYIKFLQDQVDYQRKLQDIKRLLID